jgi:hypothetical protein
MRLRLMSWYRRLFGIGEIEQEPILQCTLGGLLFFFFVAFNRWFGDSTLTIEGAERGSTVCWPYFPDCANFLFYHDIGVGYSQSIFYMALYAAMLLVVYAMWSKRWALAHVLMLTLLLWEILVTLVLSFNHGAPYYYYHIVLTSTLLFAHHKEFFLKLAFVCMYFVSATTKLDETWILGTYFTSLKDGLPLMPDALAPLITNLVIFMQVIGAWFLMSRNRILQRVAFTFMLAFHLYSGVFVSYFYPSVALPSLIVLFGPMYRFTSVPFTARAAVGWIIIALLGVFQLLGFIAPGDRRMTLEGNKFGMFMFEANHQCVVTVRTESTRPLAERPDVDTQPGTACNSFYCLVARTTTRAGSMSIREERYESGTAWNRCYPYEWWSRMQSRCNRAATEKIGLTMDHSINGGPFYRIVHESDICTTTYKTFGPNTWIKSPPQAPIMGYPVTNTYN